MEVAYLKKNSQMHFFLASNSPRGFSSKFDFLDENLLKNWKCHIIKGGPGCGKSTLIRKISEIGIKNKIETYFIHCASDPDSLDGIIFPGLNLCYIDGTSPHVVDPFYPGISGNIIDIGKFKDFKFLNNKEKIIKLFKANRKLITQAQKYLASFGIVSSDTIESIVDSVNFEKIKNFSNKIAKKIFNKPLLKDSNNFTMFASSVGPNGVVFFEENFLYSNLYEISDNYGLISDILFRYIKNIAFDYGYNTIQCLNPLTLNERIECLFIPETNTVLFASNEWQNSKLKIKSKKIESSEFYNKKVKESTFNKKTKNLLILESVKIMNKARKIYNDLENIYCSSLDLEYINNITNILIEDLKILSQ